MPFRASEIDKEMVNSIEEHWIVCNQRIVRSLLGYNKKSYHILDQTLTDMAVDYRKTGSWTITELSVKYACLMHRRPTGGELFR